MLGMFIIICGVAALCIGWDAFERQQAAINQARIERRVGICSPYDKKNGGF